MPERILAIETSCDETSVAVVEDGYKVLSNEISSQIDLHKIYGGVVPELASRRHLKNILPVYNTALADSGLTIADIDAIAVTAGPGLIGALLTGLSFAKALSFGFNKPLVTVNHLAAHLYASFIGHPDLKLPLLALVVSGGHTELIYLEEHLKFQRIGHTRDDAAGEAFDKIARRLGLGYPGGPIIEKRALHGNETAFDFPRALAKEATLDFSFSGLKSAVINVIHRYEQRNDQVPINDIAASFQQAIIDVLTLNTLKAAQLMKVKQVVLTGGVAANGSLRKQMMTRLHQHDIKLSYPSKIFCTDNAAMVGVAAHYYLSQGLIADLDASAYANLPIDQHPR